MRTFESHIAGRWQTGSGDRPSPMRSPAKRSVSSVPAASTWQPHTNARNVGGPALRALTFHERAALLRAVGKHLLADTSEFYALSTRTGATRADTAIDVDGGAGALLAYSGIGRRELPNSTVWPDGDVQSLSRDGSFVARHVNVARPGVAIQINAFNFPVWGMLESSPAFLAGVPTIAKPATPTAYIAEAAVRTILASGLLRRARCSSSPATSPRSSACSTSRTVSPSPVRRRPPNHFARSLPCSNGVRFSAEADSLNAAVLRHRPGPTRRSSERSATPSSAKWSPRPARNAPPSAE